MLARIRKAQENEDSGFTLIELLVVMIIIGILAAIAIPAFLSQKAKARDTSAKADVSTIGKEIAAYYVDSTGTLTIDTATAGTWKLMSGTTEITSGRLSQGNAVTAGTISGDSAFCVSVKNSAAETTAFKYSQTGLEKGTC